MNKMIFAAAVVGSLVAKSIRERKKFGLILLLLIASLLATVIPQIIVDFNLVDPEVHYNAIQLITSKGYSAEVHNVTTSDGYTLAMHRIPYGRADNSTRPRPVVFLMHGILCSSADWLVNRRNESFAYLLADAGYDVWMGNVRGNTYSQRHVTLSPGELSFWNFSWEDHALIDLPTMVDYVLTVTNQKQLYYIGHSQGTALGFASFTNNPELASKIRKFYALGPLINLHHTRGVFWIMGFVRPQLVAFFSSISHGEVFLGDSMLNRIGTLACSTLLREVCAKIMFLFSGPSMDNINKTRIPIYVSHTPAGTSIRNAYHWSQLQFADFCKYDYESVAGNTAHYGQARLARGRAKISDEGNEAWTSIQGNTPTPPCFNMTNLQVPTAIFTGGNDWVSMPEHVAKLVPLLQHVLLFHKHIPQYAHLDFIWGMNSATKVYDVIMRDMKIGATLT